MLVTMHSPARGGENRKVRSAWPSANDSLSRDPAPSMGSMPRSAGARRVTISCNGDSPGFGGSDDRHRGAGFSRLGLRVLLGRPAAARADAARGRLELGAL